MEYEHEEGEYEHEEVEYEGEEGEYEQMPHQYNEDAQPFVDIQGQRKSEIVDSATASPQTNKKYEYEAKNDSPTDQINSVGKTEVKRATREEYDDYDYKDELR